MEAEDLYSDKKNKPKYLKDYEKLESSGVYVR